ncbi:PilZ domain-containing protein [bacterium]|nr:PilZ domain-containing protein [bacterium]
MPAVGSLAVVTLDGQDVVGEVVACDQTHATVAVRIPHDVAEVFPAEGTVTWDDGRMQPWRRAQASATTVVELRLPLAALGAQEPRAEINLKRRVAVDVRSRTGGHLLASGHTQTLSRAGGKLSLKRALQSDERYRLSLYLPEGLLKLDAVIIRSDADKTLVAFRDVSPEAEAQLDRFLREGLVALRRLRQTP